MYLWLQSWQHAGLRALRAISAVPAETPLAAGRGSIGNWLLASYTADSKGNLTTESTYKNMPSTSFQDDIGALSISPSGKLVAAGGTGGFQVFRFDGSGPITELTGKISTNGDVEGFGWDKSGHLYVSATNALYVY